MELIDLRIETGKRFSSKVRFGKKTIELRGDLKPHNQPGEFVLNISASIETFSRSFTMQPDLKLIELPDLTSCNTTIVVTVDKQYFLSGMATLSTKSEEESKHRKPDLELMCVTLEPATDDD